MKQALRSADFQPYRRFQSCRLCNTQAGWEFRRSADWKSAIQQIGNLRYGEFEAALPASKASNSLLVRGGQKAILAGTMQYLLEHFGVAVAAITGVLAARGKRVDLFGVMVLAVVTAFGGGTVRDLCLGSTPVFWITDPSYLLNATGVAVAAFFLARFWEFPGPALQVADALALAFFTMVGAKKSLVLGTSATIAVAMGVITGVVGGVIRDVLTGEIPLVFRQQIHLYATAALIGAVVFVVLNRWRPDQSINLLVATATTLGLRLGAIRWKLSLPEFESRNHGCGDAGPPKA